MKISIRPLLLAGIILVTINGFAQKKITLLDADNFEKTIQNLPDEQLVDVRTPREFAGGYIQGAMNIDVNGARFKEQISALDKSKPVMVYCLSGGRSSKAASYMRSAGFSEIIELDGGMLKWNAAKNPVMVRD